MGGGGDSFPRFHQGEGTTKSRSYKVAVRRRNLHLNTPSPLAKHIRYILLKLCYTSPKTIVHSFYARNKAISDFLLQNEVWGYVFLLCGGGLDNKNEFGLREWEGFRDFVLPFY